MYGTGRVKSVKKMNNYTSLFRRKIQALEMSFTKTTAALYSFANHVLLTLNVACTSAFPCISLRPL